MYSLGASDTEAYSDHPLHSLLNEHTQGIHFAGHWNCQT